MTKGRGVKKDDVEIIMHNEENDVFVSFFR